MIAARPLCELPSFYWDNKRTIESVFDAVNATNINEDNIKGAKIFHDVQKLLILNDVPNLLKLVDEWSNSATLNEREILRFFAHLVIVLRRLDASSGSSTSGLLCVRKYCEYLMETNHVQQVAWYVSQLRPDSQIDLYANFLINLSHESDKKLSLSLAVENSLPIHEILSQVVLRIHHDENDDEETEMRKINALDWLLYDPKQMDEAIERDNGLLRRLKATGKDELALQAFEKIPSKAGDIVIEAYEDDLDEKQKLILKEHLSWTAYFSAKEAFDRWFEHFNKEKPKMPTSHGSQHLTKQVTLEKQTMQYNINLEQWKATQEALGKEAHDKLKAVLTFSDGWMGDPEDDEALIYLRKLCIPEFVILLHTVLHTIGQFKEAMTLADLVADETHGLYECFHKENMRMFLGKIKQSAVCQLEQH